MNLWRKLACVVLGLVLCASAAANWLAPGGYSRQYRDATDAAPSRSHWLGTDEVGRDRFARVLYGTRISLLLAPAAAFLSTLMAALIGGLAGYLGGIWARMAMAVTDLFLSLPWLFLLITARALMPLNVSPMISVLVTFLLLGLLGWTTAARVLVHNFSVTALFRFCTPGAGRRSSSTTAILDACIAEPDSSFICAVLDFDSSFHPQ